MIWLQPMIFGLMVVLLIGICLDAMVQVTPEETPQDRGTRRVSIHRQEAPGDDVIGTGAEPLGWTALDDLQLQRLLDGSSG